MLFISDFIVMRHLFLNFSFVILISVSQIKLTIFIKVIFPYRSKGAECIASFFGIKKTSPKWRVQFENGKIITPFL